MRSIEIATGEPRRLASVVIASLTIFGATAVPSLAEAEKKAAGHSFEGNAHWYGGQFHGRRTASGAVFDKMKLTAAHPSLPFGTKVRVHSMHTGKDVVVTVNDRCPRLKVRCIDLSEGAARKLGIYPGAPGHVRCQVLDKRTAEKEEIADTERSQVE